ncbi:MAG: hypothetical protein FWE08_07880, partial [Oscillospiraceae bacterium]|nr:hypothetical protein [Oscillospiraceae bacterium]
MKVTVFPGPLKGAVTILPSKSQLHRLLICAALADGETVLRSAPTEAEDVSATIACLTALGAEITWHDALPPVGGGVPDAPHSGFRIRPIDRTA